MAGIEVMMIMVMVIFSVIIIPQIIVLIVQAVSIRVIIQNTNHSTVISMQ